MPSPRGNLDTVGQVVLALAVVVAQPTEPAGQAIGIGGQDPAVDFGDARLGLIRVTLFADAHDTALNVTQNAPVAVGIRGLETEYRQGRFEPGEFGQRCAAHQRHVARQHDHARRGGNSGHGLLHGMAGAQALVLGHRNHLSGPGLAERVEHRLDPVGAVTDHDVDAIGRQRERCVQADAPAWVFRQSAAAPWASRSSSACLHRRPARPGGGACLSWKLLFCFGNTPSIARGYRKCMLLAESGCTKKDRRALQGTFE